MVTNIILVGCFGRMGRVMRGVIGRDPSAEIVAGVDTAHRGDGIPFPLFNDINHCDMPADVIVDFSGVGAIYSLLNFSTKKNIPLVICTTGYAADVYDDIRFAAQNAAIFQSHNMSLGVNLLVNTLKRVSKLLYDAQFDIEIIERHHYTKIDAPSGTALTLAESVNNALGGHMRIVNDRSNNRAKRERDEIGVHSLRGGTIVGDHSVVFAGLDEVIEFNHSIYSRDVFAVGALKAAQFMKGKPPGFYTMQDLLDSL